jgi:tRNA-dihydrouridine synthase B
MIDLSRHELRMGAVHARPGLLLAPMEGITDLPFRVICRRMGADIVYTEFVNAEGLVREDPCGPRRTRRKISFLPEERPVGIQLYGALPASMERATRLAAAAEPDLIDINCGCWVKDVALRGAGAGLLRDPQAMRQVVRHVIGATSLPVTVKTRLGWDGESIRIVDVARMLEDLGVKGLSIHCRTRAQGHQGQVDYSWISRVREAVDIPVILNGDVTTAEDVVRAFVRTGCDGVMIGRGAIRHPWVFREARQRILQGDTPSLPTVTERVDLCLTHLRLALVHFDERHAVSSLRRHYSGYFRGLRGAAALRNELAQHRDPEALIQRLGEIRSSGCFAVPLRDA